MMDTHRPYVRPILLEVASLNDPNAVRALDFNEPL